MEVKEFSDCYIASLGDENRKILFDFFVVFSRFECALKATIKYSNKGNPIQPDWYSFAKVIRPAFDDADKTKIQESIDYILENPPKVQKFNMLENKIKWSECSKTHNNKPELYKLVDHIKTVRNNLFHGGKFTSVVYDSDGAREISRNEILLKHSMNILGKLVHLDSDVKNAFFEPI